MRYGKSMSEALADVREGFTPKQIKMAIGVASDKRYAGGNMTGAVKAIEKIKKGLSDHPQVAAVLKRQNEKLDQEDEPFVKDLVKKLRKGSATHGKQADDLEKALDEDGHTDVASAKNQVKVAMSAMDKMNTELGKLNDEDSLPSWWTNKVAVAVDKLDGMADYLDTQVEEVELDEGKMKQFHMMQTDGKSAEEIAKALKLDLKTVKALMKEEVELDEGKKRYNTTSNVGKAKYVINFHDGKKTNKDGSDFFDIKIFKNKPDFENAEKELKSKGYVKEEVELDEGTWAVPETPAQKRDLKKLLKSPLKLGKEGDNAADKMYSIIGDDELFDDLYVAGNKDPEGDARPIIKKAMKRLRIKEDRWFDRDSWRLDESTKPDHIKIFNSLKKGDKVEINYDSSIAAGSTKTFVIKTKNKVYKGRVDKVTMYPDGKTGGVKFHLYQYDNRPGVYMAIGDMGASLRDIKKL